MSTAFRVEQTDGVAEVVMLGPGKGNAMGPAFWADMPGVFEALDADEAVRAVILRGDGKTFSYGLDLMAMMADLAPLVANQEPAIERTRLLDLILRMQRAFNSVAACRKPVIAAIHGWCIGGAVNAIAACDIRLCSADAKFSLREVKLAIVPDMGALQRLPPIIGEGNTRELAYTGKDIDAARALRMGLVNDVLPDADAMLAAARAMAAEIAQNPPLTVQGTKRVLHERVAAGEDTSLRFVAQWNAAFLPSQDLMEAMTAFAERRKPAFKGR
jgi:enoyl-CoA hydratase